MPNLPLVDDTLPQIGSVGLSGNVSSQRHDLLRSSGNVTASSGHGFAKVSENASLFYTARLVACSLVSMIGQFQADRRGTVLTIKRAVRKCLVEDGAGRSQQ